MATPSSLFNLPLLHEKLDNDLKLLKEAKQQQAKTTLKETPPPSELYKIKDAFATTKDQYWITDNVSQRFDYVLENGILFRPAVVDALVRNVGECFEQRRRQGLMIKGPPGIGKSHSLVNLVRHLLYHSGDDCPYFVTFIPDCAIWTSSFVLFEFICQSFGSTPDELGIKVKDNTVRDEDLLQKLVEAIDAKLATQKRRWVFIFDQIDTLFDRYNNLTSKDVTDLPFPFNYMELVIKPGRITTIISASSAAKINEISYRDGHSRFLEYDHCHSFTKDELMETFPTVKDHLDDDQVIESLMATTGGVPLQVRKLLSYQDDQQGAEVLNFEPYVRDVNCSVQVSLNALNNIVAKDS